MPGIRAISIYIASKVGLSERSVKYQIKAYWATILVKKDNCCPTNSVKKLFFQFVFIYYKFYQNIDQSEILLII
ncbi:hypothetical protein RyT2_11100 [Pseudolactococcus yaeyamensis]